MEEPLLARIAALRPDLVVIGGDITHRALPAQMRQARAFLDRIEAPLMCMPGNHDVPAWNLVARMFWPFAGFRRHFGPVLTPVGRAGDVRVMALNSADPYAWQRGKIREGEIGRVIGNVDAMGTNIVALHHPLQQLPRVDKALARRASEALYRLEASGVQVVLSGHLHRWATDALLATGRHPRVLQIQTGTGTVCTHHRRAERVRAAGDRRPRPAAGAACRADGRGRFRRPRDRRLQPCVGRVETRLGVEIGVKHGYWGRSHTGDMVRTDRIPTGRASCRDPLALPQRHHKDRRSQPSGRKTDTKDTEYVCALKRPWRSSRPF
nr:metallophosphoesterase [Paracoccus sp. NBH48]